MDEVLNSVFGNLDYFILVFLRITALIVASPIFGRRNIPNITKIGLCVFLTYIVFLTYPANSTLHISGLFEYVMLCLKELLFGLALGYVTTMFFSIVQTAGFVVDMQMGFSMVNVLDTHNNISVPITGNLLYVVLTISFFVANGHQQLIYILGTTFEYVPAGGVAINPQLGIAALEMFALSFLMAVNVAVPVIASGLLGEVMMGFIVRTTPQMNVFVVGIPLKVLLGFLVLLLMLPVYVAFTQNIFAEMFNALDYMFKGFVAVL